MKSDWLHCMHWGELLLGAGAVLTLLILAGSIALLFIVHLRPNGRWSRTSSLAGSTDTDVVNRNSQIQRIGHET